MARINVALIGLDRWNGSFGLAIRHLSQSATTAHQFTVTGYDDDRAVMDKAKELGVIDQAERNVDTAAEGAELIFISMPYHVMPTIYEAIGPVLKPGAVVVDLSPLKQPSIEWTDKYFRKADGQPQAFLVGATPIINPAYVNDPRRDLDSAQADLFDQGTLIVAPSAMCSPDAVRLVTDLAGLLGVKVHFMDPAEHDGLVASTEGLPLLMQVALFRMLSGSPGWDDMKRLTNPAFVLSTYRLETENAEDFGLFINRNRDNNVRVLEGLIQTLSEMAAVLRRGDQISTGELFSDSANQYTKWQADRGRNKWVEEAELPRPEPSRFFGMLMPGRGKKQDDSRR